MSWAERSAANLLPLSVEQEDFALALQEWEYIGDMYDLEEPSADCDLCEHPDIRYQFRIVNARNQNEMLVGSECIKRFGILATESGRRLDLKETHEKLSRDRRYLVSEARKKRLINTLVDLAHRDESFDIDSFIDYVQDRNAFTPNQLAFLFWRLDKQGMDYSPKDFKLIMRRGREKNQLKRMEHWKLKKLWPAMSSTQRLWVLENTDFEANP